MDIEKVLMKGASHEGMDALFAIKMPSELKNAFIERCAEKSLSTGRVVRALIEEFLRETEDHA